MVLFLRVYAPEVMAEYPVTNRKELIKPLKIRPPAIKPIDIVLRRSAMTEVLPNYNQKSQCQIENEILWEIKRLIIWKSRLKG